MAEKDKVFLDKRGPSKNEKAEINEMLLQTRKLIEF